MGKNYKGDILTGMLFLLCGGMLYVIFRSPYVLFLRIIDSTPLSPHVDLLREVASIWRPSDWVVYSLPGGLWSGAYILIVHSIMHDEDANTKWRWASVVPALGIFSELAQATKLLPGTFDIVDLTCYFLPLFIYSIYLKFNIKLNEKL